MPNRRTHVSVGTMSGLAVAAYRARGEQPQNMLLEVVGGGFGGYVGSRLPDVIEPACLPGHRQLAHSAVAGTSIFFSINQLLRDWEDQCRSRAQYYHAKKVEETVGWFWELLYTVIETLFHIAAGALGGLEVGYLSHLVLDGATPSGLPVF